MKSGILHKRYGLQWITHAFYLGNWWYLVFNTTIKIKVNQSNYSHWFYLIFATCFGPHLGPSSGSLIKYVSCYGTVLIWIHISATHHNHIIRETVTKLQEFIKKKNSVALVRKRTTPAERPPLVGEVSANFCGWRVSCGQRSGSPRPYSRFSRPEPYYFFEVAPQLYSRGWVDPVPDPLLLRKSGSAGNRTRDLWICIVTKLQEFL
jgi:hypothetical protein